MSDGSHPLRLLVVSHSLSTGGAERFAAILTRHLDRSRFAPVLWLATDRRDYEIADDVEVVCAEYQGIADLPRTALRLRRSIVSLAPDLVLSNVLATNCLLGAALLTLRRRPPWVARLGNAPGIGEPWGQRSFARLLYPLAAAVVTNSRGSAATLCRRHPALSGRVVVLPNPLDLDRLGDRAAQRNGATASPEGPPTLLWVGRLSPQKRVDLLLEAMTHVISEVDCRLRLCGDGPLRRRLERQAADHGLSDSVTFLGFCDDPFEEMRHAELFVLTSDYEGLPNALIEAQALGVPAVATACPHGPEEIVEDGRTGRLVPPGDAVAVATAIRELLVDDERRRQMGAAARRRARSHFAADRVVPRWEELLLAAARGDDPATELPPLENAWTGEEDG